MNKYSRPLYRPLVILVIFLVCACQNKKENQIIPDKTSNLSLKYAEGFSVQHYEKYSELIISQPWPNATKRYKFALIPKNESEDVLPDSKNYEGIIEIPISKVIATSTTHLPALELLDVGSSLIGFPGTDYVSSPYMRERIENDMIKELGQNEGLNTEVVLALNPDLLIGFGIDGVNKAFETFKNSGIPVMYNGDWTEDSPLAKAEWIKLFGELYNKREIADSIFNKIESDYISATKLAKGSTNIPTVLSGAMNQDTWYLPYGTSPEGQFLRDANVNYLWKDSSGSGSLALSFESVFVRAQDADIWINPSYFTSYEQLESNNALYSKFKAFDTKSVYSMSMTKGETGGVLYYELGIARPDLVLKDIIKICHPNLLEGYNTTFFKPLNDGAE